MKRFARPRPRHRLTIGLPAEPEKASGRPQGRVSDRTMVRNLATHCLHESKRRILEPLRKEDDRVEQSAGQHPKYRGADRQCQN